ncbi:MAG TPA: hypothetical protein VEA37_02215 [Flavobacterium sp.]|nr:hypothetical protein [Flavobacterium sp.]
MGLTLDKTFFVGNLKIADLDQTAVETELQQFIDIYETEFLQLLLGDTLAIMFIDGGPEDRWVTLQQVIYQSYTTFQVSPAANYVYWHYMRAGATKTTGSGEQVISTENSRAVSSVPKVKLAWNAMARRNAEIVAYLKANLATFPEYVEPVYVSAPPEALALYKKRKDILKTMPIFL